MRPRRGVLKLRRKGVSVTKIARELNLSSWRVNKIIYDAVRGGAEPELAARVPNKPKIKDPTEVVRLRDEGMTFVEIADVLNVTKSTVARVYSEVTGLTWRNRRTKELLSKPEPKLTPRHTCDPNEVLRLRADGKTFSEIAEQLNFSKKTVYLAFRNAVRAGKVPSSIPGPARDLDPGTIEAIMHLSAAGKTVNQISKRLNLKWGTVFYHLHKPNICQDSCDPHEVLKLRGEGKTILEISCKLSVSKGRVEKIIGEAVHSGADRGLAKLAPKRKIKDCNEVVRLRSEGKKYSEIARILKVSTATARLAYYRAIGATPPQRRGV